MPAIASHARKRSGTGFGAGTVGVEGEEAGEHFVAHRVGPAVWEGEGVKAIGGIISEPVSERRTEETRPDFVRACGAPRGGGVEAAAAGGRAIEVVVVVQDLDQQLPRRGACGWCAANMLRKY